MENKMTRRTWLQSSTAALACLALPEYALGAVAEKGGASRVWMTKEISPEALVRIYEALGRPAGGKVAVKISTGEPGGRNFLSPVLIKDLVRRVNGTIVECNTAYGGKRSRTEDHLQTAKDHGFSDIARVDIMDAEGEFTIPVRDRKHLEYDIVGDHLKNYDFMVNLAHFKGHAMGGFGGVIKNQSIGVASAVGKAYIHSAGKTRDVSSVWNNLASQDDFLESMAASAQAVADYFGDRILYINVMNNLSIDCDCDSHPHAPEMAAISSNSSLVQTRPAGLWGLHRSISLTAGSEAFRSSSSASSAYLPFSYFRGQVSATHPLLRMEEKKQLYTGVCTSTLSPGTVRARMTADSAGTTPVV